VSKGKFGKFYEKGKLFFEVFAPSEKFFDKSMTLWAIKGRFEEFILLLVKIIEISKKNSTFIKFVQ
jgi:hypothetical protein